MAGTRGHGAKRVSAAGCQRVHAASQQVDQQRPRVRIGPHIFQKHHRQQLVQKIPERDREGKIFVVTVLSEFTRTAKLIFMVFFC